MKNIIALALSLLAAPLFAEHTYPANPDPTHAEFFGKLGRDNLVTTNAPSGSEARVLPKYLHKIDFADSYPAEAAWYYRTVDSSVSARCSSVRDGNTFARNYDWPFTDAAEFIVGMSAGPNRFASVGVASVGTNLTESMVTSHNPSPFFKCLPGATLDGINENGVVCNINVASGEVAGWHGSSLHPLAAVRWVLDNGTDAESAANYLADNIGFPDGWSMNFHFMVADETSTYIVENGEAHEVTGRAVMTNFKLYPTRDESGEGQERFDILAAGADITNAWYSLAYLRGTSPVRVSDIGPDTNAVFVAWESKPREAHRGEVLPSGKVWWQSVHSSVYDIPNRVLRVAVQEVDDWYVFSLPVEKDPTVLPLAKSFADFSAGVGGVVSAETVKTSEWCVVGSDVSRFPNSSIEWVEETYHDAAHWGWRKEPGGNVYDTGVTNPAASFIGISGLSSLGTLKLSNLYAVRPASGLANVFGFASASNHFTKAETMDILDRERTAALSNAVSGVEETGRFLNLKPTSTKWLYQKIESPSSTRNATFGIANSKLNGSPSVSLSPTSVDFSRGAFSGMLYLGDDGSFICINSLSLGYRYFNLPDDKSEGDYTFAMTEDIPNAYTKTETDELLSSYAKASAITNIVDSRVSANLNTFVDRATGIEYVGKFWDGNLYYVPTGNVYPPNN